MTSSPTLCHPDSGGRIVKGTAAESAPPVVGWTIVGLVALVFLSSVVSVVARATRNTPRRNLRWRVTTRGFVAAFLAVVVVVVLVCMLNERPRWAEQLARLGPEVSGSAITALFRFASRERLRRRSPGGLLSALNRWVIE